MFTDSASDRKSAPRIESGFFARRADQVRQFICGLHGHDALLHFEQGRMSLLCVSCGHETPGWDVKGRNAAAPSGPRVIRMPLVGHRRVA
jgi:hypothetical protein